MEYGLAYYKEFTHTDGTVIRLEIHKKDSTEEAIEIGEVVQGLSLQIQGQQGDIDTPIVKTSLSMTFVDAPDIENGKKNGFWEEFYTPDAVMWKVLVKVKKPQVSSFLTIWGGYVTPDSYTETLSYRGSVNIIARDNIGHMQDFPFDAEGDADGVISLRRLVESAWAKIESPMALLWNGNEWMNSEGIPAFDTLMNVSFFEGMNWYEALEKALYAYGGVMRYIGGNEVVVTTLRHLPYYGRGEGNSPFAIEPIFVAGATRELVPAVKRIEESVNYELEEYLFPKLPTSAFTGETESFLVENNSVDFKGIAWSIDKKTSGQGWCCPLDSMFFWADQYVFHRGGGSDLDFNFLVCNTYWGEGNRSSRYAEFSRNYYAEDVTLHLEFGQPYAFNINEELIPYYNLESVTLAVIADQNGITNYLNSDGTWGTEATTCVLPSSDLDLLIPLSEFAGNLLLKIQIHHIKTTGAEKSSANYIPLYRASLSQGRALLKTNAVNTNYKNDNNVVLSRDPELGPAHNTVALPQFIKNGIFRRVDGLILPARAWAWSGEREFQMAVYIHMQLLAYYHKPSNLISGTIVNADIANIAVTYDWRRTPHILISGNYNLLNGHLEGAILREYTPYTTLWRGQMPEVESQQKSNK